MVDPLGSTTARIVKEQQERYEQMVPAGVRIAKELSASVLAAKEVALANYRQYERIAGPVSQMLKEQLAAYERLRESLAPLASLATANLQAFDHLIETSGIASHLKNLALVQQHYKEAFEGLRESEKRHADSARRWSVALDLVYTGLPKRGWYLTGEESLRVTLRLAEHLQAGDWDAADRLLVEQAAGLRVDIDKFAKWLEEQSVPPWTVKRVRRFCDHFKNNNHDEATAIGVPLIDELCRLLYDGRDFTSKGKGKHKKKRPAIAEPKPDGSESVKHYAKGFLQEFGLFQDNWDATRFGDEDYFNRHAILHGVMQRDYGQKDSAKAFMAILFICTSLECREETATA
jgi:hypothetical protein